MEISEVKTISLKKINKINKALITFSKKKKGEARNYQHC